MSFDVLNRYSASHKPWDHVGNIIPDIEHSEGERPAVEFKVASWLPVQFYDKYYENWIVCMPGKAVSLDIDGCVVPAEYGVSATTVVYTQNDVDAGVIDISTGLPLGSVKTVTLSYLTGAIESGWTAATAGVSKTSGFMGRGAVAAASAAALASYPIGVAPYAYLQWAGGDGSNPTGYRQHNYNMQHQVAVLCDYVIKLPLVPALDAAESISSKSTLSDSGPTFGTKACCSKTGLKANTTYRYDASRGSLPLLTAYTICGIVLDDYPVARNTIRTPIFLDSSVTADNATLLALTANEVSSPAAIKQSGDFFVDYDVGVLMLYCADSATMPTGISGCSGTVRVNYSHYASTASTVSKFGCVVGSSVTPGCFLKSGANSNWYMVDLTADPTSLAPYVGVMGQVLGFETYPRDGLDRVKTAFNPPIGTSSAGSLGAGVAGSTSVNLGQMDRMPGSATGGATDLINFAGAADTQVIINLISR